jgi:hypothetical protein
VIHRLSETAEKQDMEETRLKYVKVTNRFDTPYVDMFDGIPVHIDPGGNQNILPEQAAHFFGWFDGATKEHMLRHTSKRQGWNTKAHLETDDSGKTLAERLFDKLVIEPVRFRLVEEPVDTGASIPAEHVSAEEARPEMAPPPPKPPLKPPQRGRHRDD